MSLEEIVLHVAHALRDLGLVLYVGPMLAFTLIVHFAHHAGYLATHHAVRAYRTWGPGFGLSLGTWVFGLLVTRYVETGTFHWGFDGTATLLDTLGWMTFFVLWANNCRLEVWTLDPVRKLDDADEGIQDPSAYASAVAKLKGVLRMQSTLLVLTLLLWRAAHVLS